MYENKVSSLVSQGENKIGNKIVVIITELFERKRTKELHCARTCPLRSFVVHGHCC